MNSNVQVPNNTEVSNVLTTPNQVPLNTQIKEKSSVRKPAEFNTDSPKPTFVNEDEVRGDKLRLELISCDQKDLKVDESLN